MEQRFIHFDDDLVAYLERLSYLTLKAGERSRLAGELQSMFSLALKLDELNTDGVRECRGPLDTVNVFRRDEALPSFDRELIIRNAPEKADGMIIAPKTVE